MTRRHTMADLPIGTRIYYTGDMANPDGYGVVVAHRPASRWSAVSVDQRIVDGRDILAIQPHEFDLSPGRRFLTRTEHDARRAAAIAQMQTEYEARQARQERVR